MSVATSASPSASTPLHQKLYDIRDVPDSLKCHACAAVFKYGIQKTRHYEPRKGKTVCTRIELATG